MARVKVMPEFRQKLLDLERLTRLRGIRIVYTTGYRSAAYQEELRRCWTDPECRQRRRIVHEPARRSYHLFGVAVDFYTVPAGYHTTVGRIAEDIGLRYGGPGNIRDNFDGDPVHVDDGLRYTMDQAASEFNESALVEIGED